MRILIVGGGLGGMALAVFLQQRGLSYQLMERAADFSEQGFALGLWSNGRAMLNRLGLAEAFDAAGTPIDFYQIRGGGGRLLRTIPLSKFRDRYGSGYVQVSRQRLHAMLMSQVDAVNLRTGTAVTPLTQTSAGVRVRFESTIPVAGSEDGYDVVVGADGVRSAVRAAAMRPGLERFSGWRSWYGWIDRSHVPPGTMVEYLAPGRCAALFDDAGSGRALGVFFAAQPPGEPAETAAAVRHLFQKTPPALQAALESAGDSVRVGADLATVRLARWSAGRVVLIGDAAHAFEPHNGLGASMAMEDAVVLADELAAVRDGASTIEVALAAYERRRRGRVAAAQRISDQIRRLAFIKRAACRGITNLAIPLLPRSFFEREYFRLFDHAV
jgi:2-polyprenyl-6-methoxyphenol hydroxylase-like FAD-dependent oxidoreductase